MVKRMYFQYFTMLKRMREAVQGDTGQGLERPKNIEHIPPEKLTIRLISKMGEGELLDVIGQRDIIGTSASQTVMIRKDNKGRDGIIAFKEGRAVSIQNFEITRDKGKAMARGIDTVDELQGRGIGKVVREAVYEHLSGKGIDRLFIGVQPNESAQRLARSDIKHNKADPSWIESRGNKIHEYMINPKESVPRFDRRRIRWE